MTRCIRNAWSIKGNLIHAMTCLVRSWMLHAVCVIRTHVPRYAVSQCMSKLMEVTVKNYWLKEGNVLWFMWGSKRNFQSYHVLHRKIKVYPNALHLIMSKYTWEFYMSVRPQKLYIGHADSVFYDTRRRSLKLWHKFTSHSVHQHQSIIRFLIYKADTYTANIHRNTMSCLLLHVLAKHCHLQEICNNIYKSPEYDTLQWYYILYHSDSCSWIQNCKVS
jgi:hypothetical protein